MPKAKKKGVVSKAAASTNDAKAPAKWLRIAKGGMNTKADSREVDEIAVQDLLASRMEAKASKDYTQADKIALELQSMGICYLDDKKEWYTKVVVEKKIEEGEEAGGGKRKREPETELTVPATENDDAPTSEDDDSEEEREDDSFVAKMKTKLSKEDSGSGSAIKRPKDTKGTKDTKDKSALAASSSAEIVAEKPKTPSKSAKKRAKK
mmetsp:Transcript_29631/g.49928  ORF Transcript_29631/g.49928 Transcript_29631/m.49928 type:complete len:208 (+) Transcript_29631:17-640(+)|eukprot:CAMPEP_0171848644 /NCGR_PEP_ID=MMETSP0992-20121227/19144_1 /TAXON_ID=483369 /ORGANISM="non described non described, Strain CCMP2098" /LENGTH=207 /DNA_ID=CAMNT_0012467583 /DNA_START=15 /DNA_END=638 /DNA_ORIENTATION=+